jgi:hypothetical protein
MRYSAFFILFKVPREKLKMIIVTEKKIPKQEAGKNSTWDITWKEALGVFRTLSGRKDIVFFEVGPDRDPLGDQPITGLKISGNDLFIYGKQTGYIIFGSQVRRVIREHFESYKAEKITLLFSPYKELEFNWTS